MGVLRTLLFELLRAKNNSNAASTTFKLIVQYYVVLCEFVSERKCIVGAVPTTRQKIIESFNASFVNKANTFLWHIYKIEDYICTDLSIIDNTIYTCYCESLKQLRCF